MSASAASSSATPSADEARLEKAVIAQESARQAKARWPAGFEQAAAKPYRLCTRTVMDTTDPEISFDAGGECNWVAGFEREVRAQLLPPDQRAIVLRRTAEEIRKAGSGRPYDCVLGLSGGVDSSYLAVVAVENGLRPLIVHFDNGWNAELAVQNIEIIVRKLKLDLQTFVMDWPEFRDLQRSYFKASVLDLEVPTDHMIMGAVHKIAAQHRIRYVLSGANLQTEWLLPRAWHYSKLDLVNIRGIHKKYGERKLRTLPAMGLARAAWYNNVLGIRSVGMLDLIEYDKPEAKRRLIAEFGWRDYGGKHHESVFTRFYQGNILPRKFNVDKRKAHLSNLILAGQMTRSEALGELLKPTYDERVQGEDFTFVAKKLGFSEDEFRALLEQPNRSHYEFGTDRRARAAYLRFLKRAQVVKPVVRPVIRLVGSIAR